MIDIIGGYYMIMLSDIDNWFIYHPPKPEDLEKYIAIRDAAEELALTILKHTPSCPDQSAAIRKVREAVMVANASIACGGH